MGGTTAKAAIIEDGQPARTSEYEVGAGHQPQRAARQGRRLPDQAPVHRHRGDRRRRRQHRLGRRRRLGRGRARERRRRARAPPATAREASSRRSPTRSSCSATSARASSAAARHARRCAGARRARAGRRDAARTLGRGGRARRLLLAVATMTRAVKAVTTYRGRDPRDFTLCAFGGNGPLFGVEMARALGIRQVLVPPAPGVFSALGLLFAESEHELVRTLMLRGDGDHCGAARRPRSRRSRTRRRRISTAPASTVTIDALRGRPLRRPGIRAARAGAGGRDRRRRGSWPTSSPSTCARTATAPRTTRSTSSPSASSRRVERTAGRATTRSPRSAALPREEGTRLAYFGPAHGTVATPVCNRAGLLDGERPGPLLVDEYDSTCVVPPGVRAPRPRRPRQHRGSTSRCRHDAADVDPITLEVVKNALASTADEMALVLMRSAYSPVVRDTLDYSTALCDRNGRLVAQGLTLAVQLGTFPTVMRYVLEELGPTRTAGRRLHHERPVRLRRPAPARLLRDQADLRRTPSSRAGRRRWRTTPTSAGSRPAASPCTRPRSTRRASASRSRKLVRRRASRTRRSSA